MFSHNYKCFSRYIISGIKKSYCTNVSKNKQSLEKWTNTQTKPVLYGQPTNGTHPHIMKTGEVIPGIQKTELQTRRQRLMDLILLSATKTDKNMTEHLVVIPSATKQYMSDKIPYVFRQNSDFLYLSGCLEPDSCLILTCNGLDQHQSTIFVRKRDNHSELWDGPRTGVENAPVLFGIDQALATNELEPYLNSYLKAKRNCILWYDYMNPVQEAVDKTMKDFLSETVNRRWDSPKPFIHRLRLIKSPAEIALMQKSCDIASDAIVKTISSSKPGCSEHEIFARVDYECRINGAEYLAYPPVVAGGPRATIIHYINNNQVVKNNDLVLMDAGCEYHGYSSDITRTWPINGTFSTEQKLLYEIVLEIQSELINLCSTFPTLDSLFDSMCLSLGKKLQEIGLISRNASQEELIKTAFKFCPHHVSHYLGMDVHDTPLISRNIKLVPGMIITVEPGIYISDKHKVPPSFQGLGIRIEDDVLITENGPVVLSKCPKQLNDIEKISQL